MPIDFLTPPPPPPLESGDTAEYRIFCCVIFKIQALIRGKERVRVPRVHIIENKLE